MSRANPQTADEPRGTPPMGTYNSARPTPPPRLLASRSAANLETYHPNPINTAGPRTSSKSAANDPYILRVVVMVDEATEPGLSEATATRHREDLIAVLASRKSDMPIPISGVTPGQAVSFALRKRLKSENRLAVLNTLILLDELMRSVPYFYRNVANDKFFRRLWRFVVPDYKNQVRSMIPFFPKPQLNSSMRGSDAQISERVKILIRAWAEELSIMFHGRYDPDAGFLIERYRNKRSRVPFPEVPSTATPWVCPVQGVSAGRSRAGRHPRINTARAVAGSSAAMEKISLAEVENTANLFSNLIEKATDIKELRDDLCKDLAARCQTIADNLALMSANMDKEEELARAIKASELLQGSLSRYRSCMDAGRIVNDIPTVEEDALESDDEMYDVRPSARRAMSARSLDDTAVPSPRSSAYPKRSVSFSRVSVSPEGRHSSRNLASGDLPPRPRRRLSDGSSQEDSRERRPTRDEREADRERERDRVDRDRARDSRERRDQEREGDRDRDRDRDRDGDRPSSQSRKDAKAEAKAKAERKREKAAAIARRQKSEGDLPSRRRDGAGSSSGTRASLIDIADAGSTPSDDTAPDAEASEAFTLLAERYAAKSEKPRKTRKSKSGSKSAVSSASTADLTVPAAQPGMPPVGVPPAAMYASNMPGMGFNPMMMMPSHNPYAMYSSINPMQPPMGDPMGMFSAYNTVNPAMYYQSMAGAPPGMMPGMMPPGAAGAPPPPQATTSAPAATSTSATTPPGATTDSSAPAGGGTPAPNLADPAAPQQAAPPAGMMPPPPMPMPGMPGMPPMGMGSFYGSVAGPPAAFPPQQAALVPVGAPPQPQPQSPADPEQAAAYQSAMNQAAAAYHMAANAYRSIQGQSVPAGAGAPPAAPAGATAPAAPAAPAGSDEAAEGGPEKL